MSSVAFYRISAILLVLFAGGHTIGFRRVDPRWGIDAVVSGMQTTRFDVQGLSRTYWGFYVGSGSSSPSCCCSRPSWRGS